MLWAQSVAEKPCCDINSVVGFTMEDKDKLFIDKLSGPENWATWKFQMKHLLKAKGLWGMVMETDVLAAGANTAAQAEFQRRKEKAWCTPTVPDDKLSDPKRSAGYAQRTF
ncbi:dynamin-3 isoform X3 [Scomber scombrus]|uniref:Dynamin-3 isoform X3 n=1 Tax=Scomber scombrus TaxID=13677 RepID=A0AAV1PR06_SCOSC